MNEKVLDAYKRYLSKLEDKDTNFGENYKAMRKCIINTCTGRDRTALINVLLYETIKAVKGHAIKHVSRAGENWDKSAVQKLYSKLNNLQKAWDDDTSEREQRLALLADQFFRFIQSYSDKPWLQLYMYQCYSDSDYGRWLRDPKYISDDLSYIQALLEGKTPALEDSDTSDDDYDFNVPTPTNDEERMKREQEHIERFRVQCLNAQSSDEIVNCRQDFVKSMRAIHSKFPDKSVTYMIPRCDAVMVYADDRLQELQTNEMEKPSHV